MTDIEPEEFPIPQKKMVESSVSGKREGMAQEDSFPGGIKGKGYHSLEGAIYPFPGVEFLGQGQQPEA